ENDSVERPAFQSAGIIDRVNARRPWIFSGDAQALRIDGLHMFGVGIESGDPCNGRKSSSKQTANRTAANNQDVRGHDFNRRLNRKIAIIDSTTGPAFGESSLFLLDRSQGRFTSLIYHPPPN